MKQAIVHLPGGRARCPEQYKPYILSMGLVAVASWCAAHGPRVCRAAQPWVPRAHLETRSQTGTTSSYLSLADLNLNPVSAERKSSFCETQVLERFS